MPYIKILLFAVVTFVLDFSVAEAQYANQKKYDNPFLTDGHMSTFGWFLGPGVTYPITHIGKQSKKLQDTNDVNIKNVGNVGLYFEAGMFNIFPKNAWLTYMDYGLAFKMLRGKESFEGTGNNIGMSGKGKYSNSFLLANFNLNKVVPIRESLFLQGSFGANFDYRIIKKYSKEGIIIGSDDPGNIIGELHIKFGAGYQINQKLMIIPAIETPILNVYKWDNFRSDLPYFNSRYRPLILSIRFLIMHNNNGLSCPPVYSNPDDKKYNDQYMNQ